jgi:hypothetical protein
VAVRALFAGPLADLALGFERLLAYEGYKD